MTCITIYWQNQPISFTRYILYITNWLILSIYGYTGHMYVIILLQAESKQNTVLITNSLL